MKAILVLSLVALSYSLDPLPGIGRLSPVGSAGGKAYYTDVNLGLIRFAKFVEVCHENLMVPGTILSSAQNSLLQGYLEGLESNRVFWLGATDLLHEGSWFWLSTGEALDAGYKHWGLGEPIQDRLHNCAFIDARQLPPGLGYWKSNICADGLNRPLCEIPEAKVWELAAKFNTTNKYF